MKKTYYSVVYRSWGADRANEAWFDNKEEADKFASKDYHDTPVAHHVSAPATIEKYNELVAMTAFELAN